MIGVADANNFFVSCERVHQPKLRDVPCVVLSNNDRCVVARSPEAKKIGIKMGVPVYQIEDIMKKHDVRRCSSNYTLYGDMSDRIMSLLSSFTPDLEVYSIDEAFMDLSGMNNLYDYGREIVRYTSKSSGIPISLGVAPSKTLAKTALEFSKKYKGYKRLCIIDTEEKRIKALQLTPVADIWGIGRQYEKFLQYHSIKTAYDLTQKSRSWIRKHMTIVGERLWLELQGIPCKYDETIQEKKNICTSRSFDDPVTDFDYLMECVSNFAAKGAHKLRKQQSVCQGMIVFIHTNQFNPKKPQYHPSRYIHLSFPTLDTGEIIQHARIALESIYKKGYEYKKAGVIITDINREANITLDLFDTVDRNKQSLLNKAVDRIRLKHGYEAIQLAIQGTSKNLGNLRRDFLSKCPTTNFKDIIEINV